MTHNSKKAWSTIRKLCDDPCKPKQHYKTTANQVAHQLLLNGRVPNRHRKVRLDRQRYPEDPGFTRAFTAAELNIGIRVLKNGKAPGLDDIQTELIKQFGPKARDWLLGDSMERYPERCFHIIVPGQPKFDFNTTVKPLYSEQSRDPKKNSLYRGVHPRGVRYVHVHMCLQYTKNGSVLASKGLIRW